MSNHSTVSLPNIRHNIIVLTDTTVELSTRKSHLFKGITRLKLEVKVNGQIRDRVYLFSQKGNPGVWEAERLVMFPISDGECVVTVFQKLNEYEHQLLASTVFRKQVLSSFPKSSSGDPRITKSKRQKKALGDADGNSFHSRQAFVSGIRKKFTRLPRILKMTTKDTTKGLFEITLTSHTNSPDLILKTRALIAENEEELISSMANWIAEQVIASQDEATIAKMRKAVDELISNALKWFSSPYEGDSIDQMLEEAEIAYQDFLRYGNSDSLEEAIMNLRTASKIAEEGDSKLPTILIELGRILQTRFAELGNLSDIDESISRLQTAASLIPNGHSDKSRCLHCLGISLSTRSGRLGDIADLENAVISSQTAVNLTTDDHPDKPSRLCSLGMSLHTRFERLGNVADLDNALLAHQAAVDLTPDKDPSKPNYLIHLGDSLESQFWRLNNMADLDNAILSKQAAVSLTSDDDPQKYHPLTSLGRSLHSRFRRLGNIADLDNAILANRAAVNLSPDGDPNKAACLANLGQSLETRFRKLRNRVDQDDAIFAYQAAAGLIPEDDSRKTTCCYILGEALIIRYHYFKEFNDIERAISCFANAAMSPFGSPSLRFQAAEYWTPFEYIIDPEFSLTAYECTLDLIPLLAWLGLPIPDRHRHLTKTGEIIRRAAAAAISLGRYGKALEWLEQGRSVVWSQILRLRTPVDDLREVEPDLADRLIHVSQQLDGGSQDALTRTNLQFSDDAGQRHRVLTIEWESIVEQVRSLPNFESFLKSPDVSRLMKATQDGPVIVLNIAKERCDALAILPGREDILHIPLPEITAERVTELRDELQDSLYTNGIRLRAAKRVGEGSAEQDCRDILADLWKGIVKPVLNSLGFPPHPDHLPHIWWCATGPLAFLPIHAAGIYGPGPTSEQLSNYAISSYIPSLSVLLEPPTPAARVPFKLLSVIQPSAPGTSSIPSTIEELKRIQRHIDDENHVVLVGPKGTKKQVMGQMEHCNWLHLACHGVQSPEVPTKSALILQDGHLTLEEIIKLRLPHAEFAFLSACQTTAGDEKLSEESVHIAGAMLLAGYRGVVATMWSIRDDLAPEVADAFYARLMRKGKRPDNRRAAEALHFAVKQLRERPGVSLLDWLPFVHLGV